MDAIQTTQAAKPPASGAQARAGGISPSSQPHVSPTGTENPPAVEPASKLPPIGLQAKGISVGTSGARPEAFGAYGFHRETEPPEEFEVALEAKLKARRATPDRQQDSRTAAAAEAAERAPRAITRGGEPAGIPGSRRTAAPARARSTSSERADPDLQLLKRVGKFIDARYGSRGEPGTEGLGASNIVKLTAQDLQRMQEADRLIVQGRASGKPHGERGAQNCEELATLTLQVLSHARPEARFVEAGPHGIVALGLGEGTPAARARELGKDVKISDPWAGVVARGDTYPDKLATAMRDMADEGKRIRYNDPAAPADQRKKLELANDPNWQKLVLDSPMHVRKVS